MKAAREGLPTVNGVLSVSFSILPVRNAYVNVISFAVMHRPCGASSYSRSKGIHHALVASPRYQVFDCAEDQYASWMALSPSDVKVLIHNAFF